MIEAPRTGDVVRITQGISTNPYWAPQFTGGLRVAPPHRRPDSPPWRPYATACTPGATLRVKPTLR